MRVTVEGARASGVDIYPVGVLAVLLKLGRVYFGRPRIERGEIRRLVRRNARASVRNQVRLIAERARAGQWRAVKNHFNGYMAEPFVIPARMSRCGSGWTKTRAWRSLRRHGWPG